MSENAQLSAEGDVNNKMICIADLLLISQSALWVRIWQQRQVWEETSPKEVRREFGKDTQIISSFTTALFSHLVCELRTNTMPPVQNSVWISKGISYDFTHEHTPTYA